MARASVQACPEGTFRGSMCPLGSYRNIAVSAESADACTTCPRGKYCRSGIIAGNCAAG